MLTFSEYQKCKNSNNIADRKKMLVLLHDKEKYSAILKVNALLKENVYCFCIYLFMFLYLLCLEL